MATMYPRARSTSPQRGEVGLRLAMRSIVQCNPGEGPQLRRETLTPHPRLRRDLSQRERWTADAAAVQPEAVIL
ncbi:hypothetical protein V1280_005268 [Bradyrhizobium sp. AZCC 2230]